MLETSARLLALLSLLQEHREWTGQELANRLEVGPRTIRRDVDKLRSLGYPVSSARGVAGGYRLGNGARLPPLLFEDAEAVAVAVGLRSAAATSIAGIGETSMQALMKLEQVLPERLRRRVSTLAGATFTIDIDAPLIDPDLLGGLAAACRDTLRARFAYVARDGASTRRVVEPVALVHSGFNWYLVAFDVDRDDWRTFRVDRIDGPVEIGERGTRREVPGGDAAAFVQERRQAAGAGERGAEPARVRVGAPVAAVRGRIPKGFATVEPAGEDACVVTTSGPWSLHGLVWLSLMEHPLLLLGPPELVDAASKLADRMKAAVGEDRLNTTAHESPTPVVSQ